MRPQRGTDCAGLDPVGMGQVSICKGHAIGHHVYEEPCSRHQNQAQLLPRPEAAAAATATQHARVIICWPSGTAIAILIASISVMDPRVAIVCSTASVGLLSWSNLSAWRRVLPHV